MNHRSKEAADFFIEHLQYLLSLTEEKRWRRRDWSTMRRLLIEAKRWRDQTRNKRGKPENLKGYVAKPRFNYKPTFVKDDDSGGICRDYGEEESGRLGSDD